MNDKMMEQLARLAGQLRKSVFGTLLLLCLVGLQQVKGQDITELQKLVPSDGAVDDVFGFSVAISGTYAVVGAWQDDNETGAAYVYELDSVTEAWQEVQKLVDTVGTAGDFFGASVAISGNHIIVGAHKNAVGGAAYVFERNTGTGTWEQVQKILPTGNVSAGLAFGTSVCIEGTSAIVGATGDDGGKGAAYVYEQNSTSGLWEQAQKLVANDGLTTGFFFGSSCAVSEDYILIAGDNNTFGVVTGAAYIFERNSTSGNWEEVKKLEATNPDHLDFYGNGLALQDNMAIVGSCHFDLSSGTVYIYERNASTGLWQEVHQVVPNTGPNNNGFGLSVGISGAYLLVGAYADHFARGAAYLFKQDGEAGLWEEVEQLIASDGTTENWFGHAVAIEGDQLIVGAPKASEGGIRSGAAYVFEVDEIVTNNFPAHLGTESGGFFPNPTQGVLSFDIEKVPNAQRAMLFSLTGQRLLETEDIKAVDLSGISPGTYILQVFDQQGQQLLEETVIKE